MEKEQVLDTLPKTAMEFLDHESNGFKQVSIKDDFVTADGYNVYLFGKVGLSNCNTFKVVFNKMKVGAGLGWVDAKLKTSSYIANEPNVVTYRNDRTCRTGAVTNEKVGSGFKLCYVVKATADQSTGVVTWALGDGKSTVFHTTQYEPIKDKTIEWVPYIRLCDKGDIVQILFEKDSS